MVDAAGEGIQIRPHCSVAVARRRSRSAVLEPAVAPAGTDGRLFVEGVAQLHVATVGAGQLGAGRDGSCAFTSREQQGGAQTLADVSGHDDREVGEVTADAGRAADRASRLTGARRVRRALPQTASPKHVLVLPRLLVVGKLRLNARDLRDDKHARPRDRAPTGARAGGVPVAQQDARLEGAYRELPGPARSRAVRHLGVEVGVEVAVPDPTQRRATTLAGADSHRADPEQRHVVEDGLATEQAELAARQDLAPLAAHRQIHLAQVDLGAGLSAGPEVSVPAGVWGLWAEAEVHGEVHPGFFPLGDRK